ncbi:MAG: carotenoid biosynthesis protein [Fimbriimonadales bacterium]
MRTHVFTKGLIALSLLVSLFTLVGSGLLFRGVENLPPLDYYRLSYWLGILLVVFGIGASLFHMAHTQGWRPTLWMLGICVVLAGGAELIGTLTGFPFGAYEYTERLGPKFLGHVPYLIPPSWFMMLYPAFHIAYLLGVPRRALPFVVALLLTWWDVAMDPAVSTVMGNPGTVAFAYWLWKEEGQFYGMPLHNWLGWYGVSLLLAWVFLKVVPEWRPSQSLAPLAIWLIQGGTMAGLAFWVQRPLATLIWLAGAMVVTLLCLRAVRTEVRLVRGGELG